MAKAQRVLSIEIGYSLTQVCEMDFMAKKPKVYGVFSMKTPQGIINDGYVQPTEEYVKDLRSYITANGMLAKNVIFTITSTKIANREATIPAVKQNKVRDLIMTNITDYFPVDPSQYQFAHTIMDTVTDEEKNKQYRVMIMAAPTDILEGYYGLAKALELKLVSIDYTGNSIFQALRSRISNGVNLTVKIDERSSLLTVTNNGIITMQRSGIYGADQVVELMMDTDIYGDKLTYEAAVKTLRRNRMSLREDELDQIAEKEQEAKAKEREHKEASIMAEVTNNTQAVTSAAMAAKQADINLRMLYLRRDVTSAYEQLVNSIVRVIDYYNSKNRDAAIDNIIVTGIAADFAGLAEMLSAELGKNVEVLKDLKGTNIENNLHLSDISLGDYITVIGAGLQSVGFMPATAAAEAAKSQKLTTDVDKDKLPVYLTALFAVAVVAIWAIYLPANLSAKSQRDDLLARKAQLEPVQDIFNEYTSVKADFDYLSTVYQQTNNYNTKMHDMFVFFEKVMPADVEVENLSVTEENISMSLTVDTKKEAAALIAELRMYEDFAKVTCGSIAVAENQETGKERIAFAVTCQYGFNPYLGIEETETEAEGQEE